MGKVNLNKYAIASAERAVQALRKKSEKAVKAAKEALRIGVSEIAADAINRCPVDTGTLQSSIKFQPFMHGAGYLFSASATVAENAMRRAANAGETDLLVLSGIKSSLGKRGNLNYAPFVEFDPRINKPFMYPAVWDNLGRVRRRIKLEIERACRGDS